MEGFNNTTEKLAILFKVRSEGEKYKDSWATRKAAIEADPKAQATWTDFPTYPTAKDSDVEEFCMKVSSQLSIYRGKKGIFAREWVMKSAKETPSYMWWDTHGGSVPERVASCCAHDLGTARVCVDLRKDQFRI